MSESLRTPQVEPADHCYTILQDHGPDDGGWGPAAIVIPPLISQPEPMVYTGSDEATIEVLKEVTRQVAYATNKPTMLVRFSERETIVAVNPEEADGNPQ